MKNTYFIAYLFVAFILMLNGCATGNTMKNIKKNYSLDEEKGTGIVVVSLTNSGFPPSADVALRLRDATNRDRYDADVQMNDPSQSSELGCSFFELNPTKKQNCGRRLAIIELPQGEYEFYSWQATTSAFFSRRAISPEDEFYKQFRVTAGKVVYLGNLWLFYGGGQYRIQVIDMRQRDIQLLYRNYPNIYPDNIIINILQ